MKLFVVLLAIAGMAFASSTFSGEVRGSGGLDLPEVDMVIDTYPYDEGDQMSTIGASFGDYAVCDDCTYGTEADLDLTLYLTYGVTTSGSAPSELALLVVADAGGEPDGEPISQDTYSVTNSNTGYTYGGYTIWQTEMEWTVGEVTISTPVWLGPQRQDGSNWYPIGGLTVSGSEGYRTLEAGWAWEPWSNSLEEGDLFKIIEGEPAALESNTWGGIKTLF
jgi:hypothetical protein